MNRSVGKRGECLLLSSAPALRAMTCTNHSLQSYFFQKEFFGELIVLPDLNMDFTIFFNVILSDLSKHSLSFKRLALLSATPRATLTPLSCSPNFPRAQYFAIRTLTHELIRNLNIESFSKIRTRNVL